MPRRDAHRLDPARYPHHTTIQTRFQDVDMLGHINNVALAALFETARVRFNHLLGLGDWPGHRWLVARVAIDYLAEAYHPDDIAIGTGVTAIGNRSWTLQALACQADRAVATADVVLVMEKRQDTPGLPPALRGRLEQFRINEGG